MIRIAGYLKNREESSVLFQAIGIRDAERASMNNPLEIIVWVNPHLGPDQFVYRPEIDDLALGVEAYNSFRSFQGSRPCLSQ